MNRGLDRKGEVKEAEDPSIQRDPVEVMKVEEKGGVPQAEQAAAVMKATSQYNMAHHITSRQCSSHRDIRFPIQWHQQFPSTNHMITRVKEHTHMG